MLALKVVEGRHELLHLSDERRLRVIKLSVGVGEVFVHGGAPCVELFEPRVLRFAIPRHGHKAKSILWKVRWLENYN
jgi:hypothetical protein